jgi:thiosulfate reductase/polysulfide reductase chain A
MSENALTRRSFLAGSAGAVAAAGLAGYVGFGAWEQAHAEGVKALDDVETVHTLCNACSNKCGFTAYVVDGRLRKPVGDADHPYAQGKLCARGYGYTRIAYSEDRLTDPLKKNDKGEFEAISWEQAFQEIGEKTKGILADGGPCALAVVQDPRPSGAYYAKQFINALGSPNCYTHAAACDLSRTSGYTQAIGASSWTSDVANAKMTMFIGRSYADGIRPSSIAEMERAHKAGSYIVIVDPRCNDSTKFADEWQPVKPGTDLALVLAMSRELVSTGRYDKKFIADNAVGFEEYVRSLDGCTAEWAAGITGLKAVDIVRLAHMMWNAAPAASIEQGWRGAIGSQYANSGEAARSIALFNALLGCYNQEGGALFLPSVSPGNLDESMFPPVPKPQGAIAGSDEYPLALTDAGSVVYAAQAAREGSIKGMFFYNSNMAAGYSNTAYMAKAMETLDLSVVIDVQMSETAALADYVLPECSYLERSELPAFVGGMVPCVTMRTQAIDVVHPNTKPCDEIFKGLAEACGIGQYFDFTMEDLAAAQLASVGVDYAAAKRCGTVYFPSKAFSYGKAPTWKTPTGKIQFTSAACEKAGLAASPSWIEPLRMPVNGELRLIQGKQAIHSHTMTANIPELMEITRKYDLTRVWINADTAAHLGISDGDEVEVSNGEHTGTVRAKVTQRIHPTTLFMPGCYGVTVKEQKTAYGIGLRPMDFAPFGIEPAYGSAMTHETCVTVKKAGA